MCDGAIRLGRKVRVEGAEHQSKVLSLPFVSRSCAPHRGLPLSACRKRIAAFDKSSLEANELSGGCRCGEDHSQADRRCSDEPRRPSLARHSNVGVTSRIARATSKATVAGTRITVVGSRWGNQMNGAYRCQDQGRQGKRQPQREPKLSPDSAPPTVWELGEREGDSQIR